MAVAARRDSVTRLGALQRIGEQLGINPETLRNWVTQAEIYGVTVRVCRALRQRIAQLEREDCELRRSNAILRSASAFFAAELDSPLK